MAVQSPKWSHISLPNPKILRRRQRGFEEVWEGLQHVGGNTALGLPRQHQCAGSLEREIWWGSNVLVRSKPRKRQTQFDTVNAGFLSSSQIQMCPNLFWGIFVFFVVAKRRRSKYDQSLSVSPGFPGLCSNCDQPRHHQASISSLLSPSPPQEPKCLVPKSPVQWTHPWPSRTPDLLPVSNHIISNEHHHQTRSPYWSLSLPVQTLSARSETNSKSNEHASHTRLSTRHSLLVTFIIFLHFSN